MARKSKTYTSDDESDAPDAKADKKILDCAKERLKNCISNEHSERAKMMDDLRFRTLDQWPAHIRKARETDPNGARPCLTIDKINQYIAQVVNDMRQNRPAIKVRPVNDEADVDTSKILQGTVRHIEDQSNASVAYETAGESQTAIGLGFFRFITDFISPDSFDQEIFIKSIPDAFSVYLAPHIEPDGSDADYGFIIEDVAEDEFKRDHPKAKSSVDDFATVGDLPYSSWRADKTVKRIEYFYKDYQEKTLLFLADGRALYSDMYDGPEESIVKQRTTQISSVKWCKFTGAEILDKRDWPGKYIPIVEVTGKESRLDGKRILWGLVRAAKDNLRMYNYWASAATERMALAPKPPFIAAEGQLEGRETEWKNANKESRAVLQYKAIDINGNPLPPPRRVEPAPVETAMIGMMTVIEHDIQTSLGMFRAAVGEQQGQQSGRALLALERSSDTGTFNFPDNLSRSIRYGGKILIDLIPKIYDTRRVLHILGEDGASQPVTVDPAQPQASNAYMDQVGKVKKIYNLGIGEYDVTVTSGPSYNTKRMEAAAVFSDLAKGAADPQSAAVMRYLTVKNSDFTSSDEAINMLKALLPPQIAAADTDEPIPAKALQAIAQLHQQGQQAQQVLQKMGQENQQLKTGAQTDMAKVHSDHDTKMQALSLEGQVKAAKQQLDREEFEFQKQLETEKAAFALMLEANKATNEHNRKVMELGHHKEAGDAKLALDNHFKTQEQTQRAQAETAANAPQLDAFGKELTDVEKQVADLTQQLAAKTGDIKIVEKRDKSGRIIGGVAHYANGETRNISIQKPAATLQ